MHGDRLINGNGRGDRHNAASPQGSDKGPARRRTDAVSAMGEYDCFSACRRVRKEGPKNNFFTGTYTKPTAGGGHTIDCFTRDANLTTQLQEHPVLGGKLQPAIV